MMLIPKWGNYPGDGGGGITLVIDIQTERDVRASPATRRGCRHRPGISRFATLNSFKRPAAALRKAQQEMSRKARFPRNRKKAKVRVQRLHARIRNGRRDGLHKTTISKNHAMVCSEALEDLKVKNMSKSTAGSTEQPGDEKRGPRVFSSVAKAGNARRFTGPVRTCSSVAERPCHANIVGLPMATPSGTCHRCPLSCAS